MKKIIIPIFALLLIAGSSCQEKNDNDNENEMKALYDKSLDIFNEGNLSMIDEIYAPNFVLYSTNDIDDDMDFDGFKELVTNFLIGFPDLNVTVEELIIKDDMIIDRWIVTGTNTGPQGEYPPTGKKIRYEGMSINHVVDGEFVETRSYYDQTTIYMQLGFTIAPPETQNE